MPVVGRAKGMACDSLQQYVRFDIFMEWTIEILNDVVRAELEALPADQIARFLRIGALIQSLGWSVFGSPM